MENKKRILVVDDEQQITLVLRSGLTRHGYDVRVAADGESALELAVRNEEVLSESVAARQPPPIQYVTENGFSIIRLSETRTSAADTALECRFLVRNACGWEREISVEFNEQVIALVQNHRRSPLSANSGFWLNCAEHCLATYLWETDGYPPHGQLTVTELCIDELLLGEHWRD